MKPDERIPPRTYSTIVMMIFSAVVTVAAWEALRRWPSPAGAQPTNPLNAIADRREIIQEIKITNAKLDRILAQLKSGTTRVVVELVEKTPASPPARQD